MARKTKSVPVKKKPKPRQGLERPFNGNTWTTARFYQFIRSSLRRSSSRWGPCFAALKDAEVGKQINAKSGRIAMHYRCASCGNAFARKDVEIDHIAEVGSLKHYDDLPGFVQRLFCEKEGFQILCRENCHHKKTHVSKT